MIFKLVSCFQTDMEDNDSVQGGDEREIFTYETQKEPRSPSKGCEIQSGNESDLLPRIKGGKELQDIEPVSKAAVPEVLILVKILKPEMSKTF